jgi:hypothetical protein|nr:MAG TPA_asm: hypothetical protein [Caudoviricetes sp.]
MDNNIIPIQLDYRFVTTRKIWQYDYGQILSITGQNLPTATEVHFSLDIRGGSTLSRIGTTMDGATTVKIPDELLKNNGKSGDFSIYAFIYVTDEESGNTEYRITIPVYSRPKPENPSVDPAPEPNIFHETVTAVNNAADRAEKAAKDTEQIRDNLNLDLSEKITRPQSAKVGQVIAVKEVGTDGKPTDFEAKDMTGGVSTEEIKEAVGAYMQEHPFEETDPTVPDWAKQPEKPTYTAEEVGALPDNTKIPTKTSELENDSGFLVSPPTPEPGKILKIRSVNEDGTFVCEWAADGGSNLDVRINGESIVQDGVAEIPISSHDTLGLVYTDNSAGGYTTGLMNQQGRLQVNTASIDDVNKRRLRKEIDCSNFDYAVKAAMCDGKGAAWTAEEQAAARARIGALDTQDMIDITEITMDAETLKYVFPSFADYRILEISFLKTYKAPTELTGNTWLKIANQVGWVIVPIYANCVCVLDTSGKSCKGLYNYSNNPETVTQVYGLIVDRKYCNSEFREAPYLMLPNVKQAQYYAECNTIIKVRGIKR